MNRETGEGKRNNDSSPYSLSK